MSNFLAEGEQLDDGEDIRTGVQGKASLKFLYAITAGRGPSCFPRDPPPPPPAAKRPHTQYNREKAEGVCLCRIGRQPWQRRRRGRGGTETQPRQRNTIPPLVSSSRGGSSSSLWEEFPSIGDCSVSREEGFLLSESGAGSKGPGRGGKIWELIEALTCLSK